MQYIL
jgi:serine/threonine protein kinase